MEIQSRRPAKTNVLINIQIIPVIQPRELYPEGINQVRIAMTQKTKAGVPSATLSFENKESKMTHEPHGDGDISKDTNEKEEGHAAEATDQNPTVEEEKNSGNRK